MTPTEKANELIVLEIFYWGDKGLETTQRCSQKAVKIRSELMSNGASDEVLFFWIEVNKAIYNR